MDIDKILRVVIPVFIDTADIRTLSADSLSTLLNERIDLLNPLFYFPGEISYSLKFIRLITKDFSYVTNMLMKRFRVPMN